MAGEGLRLFFPLAALHGALWPLLWVVAFGFGLPFAETTAPGQWHAQEMIVGSFGAALLGFLTSALPEWTDTPRLSGRPLFILAGLWGIARLAGFFGVEPLILVAGLADQAWLIFLLAYVVLLSWRRRTTGLLGFLAFLVLLAGAAGALRLAMLTEDFALGETAVRIAGFAFLGLLGLSLARITVPVTNLVLDPSEATSPYRPHPGRVNLAPGLVGLLLLAELAGASETVRGYLMIAAGGAFLDRVAEAFVGREAFRAEIAALALSSALAGAGLLLAGLSWIGLPLPFIGGLHVMLMGGLGMGVLTVLSIAGLLHTGQPLSFPAAAKIALGLLMLAVVLRVLPDYVPAVALPGGDHGLAAGCWALALLLWLKAYLPLLWSPETLDTESC
jgi:uncharacterized protein involved in response to NO